jgi:signal transduction histidine kinase
MPPSTRYIMRHPLRLLLYIEWIAFAVVMALEVTPQQAQSLDQPAWLNIGLIVLLALMGLRLPTDRLPSKILYTIAQIILILIAPSIGIRQMALLYTIVVIRSYLIFGRKYRLWITSSIFVLYLMTMNLANHHRHQNSPGQDFRNQTRITQPNARPAKSRQRQNSYLGYRGGFVVLFGGILLSLQLLIERILAEKQAKEELALANQRIRKYALKAQEIGSLQERNRIAREIHDSLGHSLTALNLHLEMALKLSQIQPEKSRQVLAEAKRLGSIALHDVRISVSTLRSDPLQNQDATIAIQKLVNEFQLSNQIKTDCHIALPVDLAQPIAIAIYRIIQEALTNISKYAQATEVSIKIHTDSNELILRIRDNGQGFIPTNNSTGFGLQGMRERVLSLQGQFELVSAPQSGCQILAIIPLAGSESL